MSSSQKEKLVYKTSLHWVTFLDSIFWVCLGFLIFFLHETYVMPLAIQDILKTMSFWVSVGMILFGLIMLLVDYVKHKSSEFAVTNYRVIIKVGVFNKKSIGLNLSNIESVEVEQSFFGQVLGFGTIQIIGTGTADNKFHKIKNPTRFRKKIQITAQRRQDQFYGGGGSIRPSNRPNGRTKL